MSEIHRAALNGDLETLRDCLNSGDNPNARADVAGGGPKGETPLHWAAMEGKRVCVALLLERGADPNLANSLGMTALHMAAQNNYVDVVRLLVKKGADIKLETKEGQTAKELAEKNNRQEVLNLKML